MRKIKFRAWDGEQMVSPDYIDRLGTAHWKANSIPTSSAIIMQYTGLKDKNGKEIYEGDIVLTDEVNWRGEVVFDGGMFYCQDKKGGFSSNCNWSSFVVLGNLYETPELFK